MSPSSSWRGARRVLLPMLGALALLSIGASNAFAAGAVVNNGTVRIGVNDYGDLNYYDGVNYPGAFTSTVGLRYMPTGKESTADGCTCEGWGVGDARTHQWAGANTVFGRNNLSIVSFSHTADSAVSVTKMGSTLQITHDYHPSAQTPNLYEVTVSIKNISSTNVDLRYRRTMDWDIEPTPFAEYVTNNGGTASALLLVSDNGFADENPFNNPGGVQGNITDNGPADHGANFDFGFGTLAPGDTKTFQTYYGGAGTEADMLAALGAVGAEAYSLGEPSSPGGKDLGVPNTFAFAFKGVGGKPIIKPKYALSVSPDHGSKTVGDSQTFSATLENNGEAMADTDVKFSVSGANSASQTVKTNANGVATFTYSGSHVGDDAVAACFDATNDGSCEASGAATMTWTDATPPTVEPTVTGTQGDNGWYTSDVGVSWAVNDGESAVTSSGCDSVTVSTDTEGRTFTCSATSAGGTTTKSVTVKRDATAPSISGDRTAPNANGWNNTDVNVTFHCADGGSGVATCSDGSTVSAEGAGKSVDGTVKDNAGNTASTTVGDINIDKTAPTISASRTQANAAGWNNGDVTITFACNDDRSGVDACSPAKTVSAEGSGQSAGGSVTDKAGNTASTSVGNINIDKTNPVVTLTGGGTYTVDQTVTIGCTATDSLSGIASDTCAAARRSVPAYTLGLGDTTFSASATDNAGNSASDKAKVTVKVDADSLCALTKRWVTKDGVATSMCAKLSAAAASAARGQLTPKNNQLAAYRNELDAQSGKSIDADKAKILSDLSKTI